VIKTIVRPSAHRLSESDALGLRARARDEAHRQADYDVEYDFSTLWYDAFHINSGKAVMLQAPPPLNLSPWFNAASARTKKGTVYRSTLRAMDRNMSMTIDTNGSKVSELVLSGPGLSVTAEVSPNHANWFSGRRVLFGKSQDNPLEWLHDWAKYHVRRHGADAILLYDHGSKKHSLKQILEAVASAGELQAVVVVDWNFPFGPPGVNGGFWDSDFCQYGILEHARWRFLSEAKSVLSIDIDELAVAPKGTSVFEACERSPSGYLRIFAHWVYWCHDGLSSSSRENLRHLNHRHRKKGEAPCFTKWAACPARLPANAQWTVHAVCNAMAYSSPAVTLKHCHSLTNLGYKSVRASGIANPSEDYEVDGVFCSEADAVFGSPAENAALAASLTCAV
jgi:hypothetical protein